MENKKDIEKIISNAAASIEMEGFYVDEECKEWCREYLRDEITMDEYMKRLLEKVGIEYNPDK
jgi:hypothetical protein